MYPVFNPMQPSTPESSLLWFVSVRPPTVTERVETMRANVSLFMAAQASTAMSLAVE